MTATDGAARAGGQGDVIGRMLLEDIRRQGGECLLAIDRAERGRLGQFENSRSFAIARERIEEAMMWATKAVTRHG